MNLYEQLEVVEHGCGLSKDEITDIGHYSGRDLAEHLDHDTLVLFNVIRSFREVRQVAEALHALGVCRTSQT